MYALTSLITLLAIGLYFYTSINVARARAKYSVPAPATTGNPDFERAFRIQMNTLEWMPIFLPSMWLCAVFVGEFLAVILGLVWIAGRILYIRGYAEAAEKRGMGFGVQALASVILWVLALIGVLAHGMGGGA
jgi:glutathione S-transferase